MSNTQSKPIRSYREFWLFYLGEHSKPLTKKTHAAGLVIGACLALIAIVLGHPWGILLWPLIGYGFAWYSHFFIEKNRPATWKYPFWSLISDFRLTGRVLFSRVH